MPLSRECTYPLLCQLPCLFVLRCPKSAQSSPESAAEPAHLRVPQQFHHASLVCGEPSHLPDHRSHKLGFRRLHALALARAQSFFDGCRRMPVIEPSAEVCIQSQIVSHVASSFKHYRLTGSGHILEYFECCWRCTSGKRLSSITWNSSVADNLYSCTHDFRTTAWG